MYNLEFKNGFGTRTYIGKVETVEEAFPLMRKFCDDCGYKWGSYARVLSRGNNKIIDYGSHTEFFHLEYMGEGTEEDYTVFFDKKILRQGSMTIRAFSAKEAEDKFDNMVMNGKLDNYETELVPESIEYYFTDVEKSKDL